VNQITRTRRCSLPRPAIVGEFDRPLKVGPRKEKSPTVDAQGQVHKTMEIGNLDSITAAARQLIDAGWTALYEKKAVESRPGAVPGESADTPRKAIAVYLRTDLIDEMKRIAAIERRTVSAVVTTLLIEALQARQDRAHATPIAPA
jgi:hypothetical protein